MNVKHSMTWQRDGSRLSELAAPAHIHTTEHYCITLSQITTSEQCTVRQHTGSYAARYAVRGSVGIDERAGRLDGPIRVVRSPCRAPGRPLT